MVGGLDIGKAQLVANMGKVVVAPASADTPAPSKAVAVVVCVEISFLFFGGGKLVPYIGCALDRKSVV